MKFHFFEHVPQFAQVGMYDIYVYHIAGIFRGGKIFVDMENFVGSWKNLRGYVYVCTNGRGLLHLW